MAKKRKQTKGVEKTATETQANTIHTPKAWIDDSTLLMQLIFLCAALVLLPRPTDASTIPDLVNNPKSLFVVLRSEKSLLSVSVGVAIVQTWYGTYLRRQRIQIEHDFSNKKDNADVEKEKQLNWAVIKGAIAVTVLATFALQGSIVLLGAPLFILWRRTLLLSFHLALITVLPLAWALPTPWQSVWTWKRLLSMFSPNGSFEKRLVYPLIGGWVGAYVGASAVLLDWNRDWQRWPVSSAAGTWIGYVLASVYAVASAR